jgi:hypothetical protein
MAIFQGNWSQVQNSGEDEIEKMSKENREQ